MDVNPRTLPLRSVGEWTLRSERNYGNPFADVLVEATFTSPSKRTHTVPAFYGGNHTWRVRYNPGEVGGWMCRTSSRPHDPGFQWEGHFDVEPRDVRGFLRATPGRAWGLEYESGEPVFLFGDTTYNLLGMAHCGVDVESFLRRRARQGFNLLRVRVPVSPFHPPEAYNEWQNRRTWPWGGSEQKPLLDRFNLDYFRTVDRVFSQVEELGLGLEVIMEAWGFEIPFCRRDLFVPEWEELWMRYLVARYDAYNCVHFWTLMNEYEYYPDGDWRYNPVADRWAMRMARWVKSIAPHDHIVSVHNGPREPRFAQRFALDPEAIDAIMFQEWGARDEQFGWLATGIEDQIRRSLEGWIGSAVFAEYGYERNPELVLRIPGHRYCDEEHTRRGAWRGAFCALGVIHGFDNSWGPFEKLSEDQPGLVYLLHLRGFFTEIVPFERMRPAPELVVPCDGYLPGEKPLALASPEGDIVAAYLPVGGGISLNLPRPIALYSPHWFNPCTGELIPARARGASFASPETTHNGHPQDWVLVLRSTE